MNFPNATVHTTLTTVKKKYGDIHTRAKAGARFSDDVKKGAKYILVDDHITQGGTLSELRHYIENNGGEVVEIMALTSSQGSTIIAPSNKTIEKLIQKFGENELTQYLKDAGIAGNIRALTESEGRYLLKLLPNTLRDRSLEERQKRSDSLLQNEARSTRGAEDATRSSITGEAGLQRLPNREEMQAQADQTRSAVSRGEGGVGFKKEDVAVAYICL